MFRCAICDDEADALNQVETLIQSYNHSHNGEDNFQLKAYISPQCLWDDVEDGQIFDVFILDVEMDVLDGIALAERIRKAGSTAVIIFLSSHTEFKITREGYKVQALRYVSKSAMETGLVEALEAAVPVCKKAESAYLTLKHYTDIIRIPISEIIYVHRIRRMTEIVTERQGNRQIKRPLRDVFHEINDERFLFIVNKGCFVNSDFILQVTNSTIILKDKTILPVSRNMLPQVKSALLRLWGGLE